MQNKSSSPRFPELGKKRTADDESNLKKKRQVVDFEDVFTIMR